MIRKYPQYRKVSPIFKDIPMSYRLIKGFKSHCRNIVSGCIDALDDVDIMEAILHTIGERHGRRGQDRQQFIDNMKEVIMEIMKHTLKSKFTIEVECCLG